MLPVPQTAVKESRRHLESKMEAYGSRRPLPMSGYTVALLLSVDNEIWILCRGREREMRMASPVLTAPGLPTAPQKTDVREAKSLCVLKVTHSGN